MACGMHKYFPRRASIGSTVLLIKPSKPSQRFSGQLCTSYFPLPAPPAYMIASRILFTRRIVQLWYNRKGNAEGQYAMATPKPRVYVVFVHVFSFLSEKSLATLKLARRNKVEEIKKKTNYYQTRDLLERYEDGPSKGSSPAWPKNGPVARFPPQQPPSTPQRAAPAAPPNTPANFPTTPISPGLQSQLVQRASPEACTHHHAILAI